MGRSGGAASDVDIALGTSPTTSALGDAAAGGSATDAAKTDHRHGREAFGNVTAQTTSNGASANGSAVTPAHSDHTHGTPANVGNGSFGDGSDGVVNFDGTTTVLGLTPSTGAYTLTRDLCLADGSQVSGTGVLLVGGFIVNCIGTFTLQSGQTRISANGGNATGTNQATGGIGALSSGSLGVTSPGANGGTGVGAQATALTDQPYGSATVCNGGAGGAGGTAGATAGGANQPGVPPVAARSGSTRTRIAPYCLIGSGSGSSSAWQWKGGTGGSAGAGDATNNGGGGGGGGGFVIINARIFNNAATAGVVANGGTGGTPTTAAAGKAVGGGGGGGGGLIIVNTTSNLSTGTMTAAGGAFGSFVNNGGTGGANGVAGGAGTVQVNVFG